MGPYSCPPTRPAPPPSPRNNAPSPAVVVATRPRATTAPVPSSRHHTVDVAWTSMPRYLTVPSLRVEPRCRLDRCDPWTGPERLQAVKGPLRTIGPARTGGGAAIVGTHRRRHHGISLHARLEAVASPRSCTRARELRRSPSRRPFPPCTSLAPCSPADDPPVLGAAADGRGGGLHAPPRRGPPPGFPPPRDQGEGAAGGPPRRCTRDPPARGPPTGAPG